MEQGIKRAQRDYSLAFKLSMVEQVEKSDLTYKQAQRRYGIQGARPCWYGYGSTACRIGPLHPDMPHRTPPCRSRGSKPLTPEQRINELETQLREAQEKAALFEAVLDVMRKDYGITVKMPSGRSSHNSGSKS
ncbi:hypothetical protein FEQ05_06495 [Burkholderia pseudomultivorans]|uniref:Putative transposase n=1 Tax=Burkholderia pseudomultivorans TaxID=1207504 RepID=A0A6P2HIF2_9BURK|nr:hypothetical protein [Burkholderia pseudomultivorans]MDR8733821.1 hypothetical protein [Burkholderia pseudomultivorans]MDR8743011.1 hypothetical protein [Burkholderia pseudomultivorans]MDR8752315.1 hypothetical protein [Burkholderia pseudomultivorans]MDR8778295.1 hypothetical protein [Burkholderia pseudomultivorans]